MSEPITCPVCGGPLEYWKEYIVTKTQAISKTGKISSTVKTSKPEEAIGIGLEGFRCKKCGWVFNTINEIEKYEMYPYLMEWLRSSGDEIKV